VLPSQTWCCRCISHLAQQLPVVEQTVRIAPVGQITGSGVGVGVGVGGIGVDVGGGTGVDVGGGTGVAVGATQLPD